MSILWLFQQFRVRSERKVCAKGFGKFLEFLVRFCISLAEKDVCFPAWKLIFIFLGPGFSHSLGNLDLLCYASCSMWGKELHAASLDCKHQGSSHVNDLIQNCQIAPGGWVLKVPLDSAQSRPRIPPIMPKWNWKHQGSLSICLPLAFNLTHSRVALSRSRTGLFLPWPAHCTMPCALSLDQTRLCKYVGTFLQGMEELAGSQSLGEMPELLLCKKPVWLARVRVEVSECCVTPLVEVTCELVVFTKWNQNMQKTWS